MNMAGCFERLKTEIDQALQFTADGRIETMIETCECCQNSCSATTLTVAVKGCDQIPCVSLKPDENLFVVAVITECDEYFVGSGSYEEGKQTVIELDSSNAEVPLVDLIAALAKGMVWETSTYWKDELAFSSIEIHVGAVTLRATNSSFVLKPLASLFPAFKRETRRKLSG
jgi:hypothetical protein